MENNLTTWAYIFIIVFTALVWANWITQRNQFFSDLAYLCQPTSNNKKDFDNCVLQLKKERPNWTK